MASPSPIGCDSLPNPLAPAAWLPPDFAPWYAAAQYVFSAVFGAWLWDVVMALGDEIRMFRKKPLAISNIIYVLARLLSGGCILGSLLFEVAPQKHCGRALQVLSWFGAFAVPCNGLLFFLRVRGVFHHSRLTVAGFAILWLSTLSALSAPFGFQPVNIGPTAFCLIGGAAKYSAAGFVTIAIFDTIVFSAITFRVLSFAVEDTWRGRIRAFMKGQGVGHVSKALLQTGQLYYLATTGVNVAVMVILLSGAGAAQFQAMVPVPNVALQNVMACKVFRLLKLGLIQDNPTTWSTFRGTASRNTGTTQTGNTRRDIIRREGDEEFGSRPPLEFVVNPSHAQVTVSQHSETTTDNLEMKDWKAGAIV
ncbi:unnamed protein product [Somion occarium]|uniref:Transmembrane protein n=1 Tax=Somion occarium TaxID=3059160 RepID=A0ABP1DJE8_9APHY